MDSKADPKDTKWMLSKVKKVKGKDGRLCHFSNTTILVENKKSSSRKGFLLFFWNLVHSNINTPSLAFSKEIYRVCASELWIKKGRRRRKKGAKNFGERDHSVWPLPSLGGLRVNFLFR
jgi:hypothetical protein